LLRFTKPRPGRDAFRILLYLNYYLTFNNMVSSKVYINKGLMESILSDLFNIEDRLLWAWSEGSSMLDLGRRWAIFDLCP
jgi:hypothetical protein